MKKALFFLLFCFVLTKNWFVMACLTARPKWWSTVTGFTTSGCCGLTRGNLSPLYSCYVVKHNTCCNYFAGFVQGHSEAAQAREAGLQYAKSHLYPNPGSGMGHIEPCLWPCIRVMIGGHQKRQASISPVSQQHAEQPWRQRIFPWLVTQNAV